MLIYYQYSFLIKGDNQAHFDFEIWVMEEWQQFFQCQNWNLSITLQVESHTPICLKYDSQNLFCGYCVLKILIWHFLFDWWFAWFLSHQQVQVQVVLMVGILIQLSHCHWQCQLQCSYVHHYKQSMGRSSSMNFCCHTIQCLFPLQSQSLLDRLSPLHFLFLERVLKKLNSFFCSQA